MKGGGGAWSNESMLTSFWKKEWRMREPSMVKLFVSKACSNLLPTRENLHRRHIVSDPLYPICSLETKTVGHVLWSYTFTRGVWMDYTKTLQKSTSDETNFAMIVNKLTGILTSIEIQVLPL
jgi:hypothetical protein